MDLLFTLRIVRLNPPQVFYWFSFLGSSYYFVIYFSVALHDMIVCFNLDLNNKPKYSIG